MLKLNCPKNLTDESQPVTNCHRLKLEIVMKNDMAIFENYKIRRLYDETN